MSLVRDTERRRHRILREVWLREKGGTDRKQPVSPTLIRHLREHAAQRRVPHTPAQRAPVIYGQRMGIYAVIQHRRGHLRAGGSTAPSGSRVRAVALRTGATAVVSTGLAVAVNYATGAAHSLWPWVAVVGLTVASFVIALEQSSRETAQSAFSREPAKGVELHNVTARGFRARHVKSSGTGVTAVDSHFVENVDVENVTAGHGDAPHPC